MWLEGAELYHYKARAYDPHLGRFLQPDPIGYGDGLNMYAYVGGDAMNRIDPQGTEDEVVTTGTRQRRRRYVPINPYGLWNGRDIIANAIQNGLWGGGGGANTSTNVDEVITTGTKQDDDNGHEYFVKVKLCASGSNLTHKEAVSILRRSIVPRPFALRATVPDEGGRYLVADPNIGFPGGFVDTIINPTTLSGRNRTVPGRHVFQGDVNVNITRNSDGSVDYIAHGVGTSNFIMDAANNALGPAVFLRMGMDSGISATYRGLCF